MVVIAIAGGFGDLGQQFLKAFKASGKHDVIILKRQEGTSKVVDGFDVAEVDYSNVDALTEFLNKRQVHTIVSALGVHWPEASENQINLIKAAGSSKTVKRFVPAEYTFNYEKSHHLKPFYCKDFTDKNRLELAKSKLEWTIIYCGQFMDYFGLPNISTTMSSIYLLLDIPHKVAVLPGDGTAAASFILTSDLAVFVAALPDIQQWDPVYNVIGETMTLNDLVKAAERATGTKLEVKFDSIENLQNGSPLLLPGNEEIFKHWGLASEDSIQFCAAISVGMAHGSADIIQEGTSLNKILPKIKTVKIEEYIRSCFANR